MMILVWFRTSNTFHQLLNPLPNRFWMFRIKAFAYEILRKHLFFLELELLRIKSICTSESRNSRINRNSGSRYKKNIIIGHHSLHSFFHTDNSRLVIFFDLISTKLLSQLRAEEIKDVIEIFFEFIILIVCFLNSRDCSSDF